MVGRFSFSLLISRPLNDGYTFGAGLWIFCVGLTCVSWVTEVVREAANAFTALRSALHVVFKMCYLFIFIGFLIPMLTGTLFQLLITNLLQTNTSQCAIFFVLQDWILGGFIVKLAYNAVLNGKDSPAKTTLLALTEHGLSRVNIWDASTKVLFPVTGTLLLIVLGPVAVTTAVSAFGVSSLAAARVYRALYFCVHAAFAIGFPLRSLVKGLCDLHKTIRDEKYLVGQRLHNLDRSDHQAVAASS